MRISLIIRHFPAFGNFLAILAFLGAVSHSYGIEFNHMTVLGRTSQPIGHYNYCKEYPGDCASNKVSPLAPKLTRKKWQQMIQVNSHANSSVKPVTDQELYSKEEHWTLPKKYGDCEDYVLLKRQLLIDRGWPVSSLLVTVVRQRGGEGHAVLTVRTNKSDYILDNLNGEILPWSETEYHYIKRQSTLHSGRWIDIKDSRDIVGSIK
jgi:predicted transglutaminase-like cysteine proteinase